MLFNRELEEAFVRLTGTKREDRVRCRLLLLLLTRELGELRLIRLDEGIPLLREVEGTVWQWTCPSDDLLRVRQAHLVSGTARRADGVRVRVLAETRPDPAAVPDTPTLEDAYLDLLARANGGEEVGR